MTSCTLCEFPLTNKNIAIFDCGHTFHLTCVFSCPHSTLCSLCTHVPELLPNIGTDRQVAMTTDIMSKLEQKSLKPIQKWSVLQQFARTITPLTPKAQSFRDHIRHNKKLSKIREYGFIPEDAVKERIRWSDISNKYSSKDMIDFGFEWCHMIEMGIIPSELKKFTWVQQQHKLKLDANKMLQMRLTITELSDARYTTHQLIDLGFTWSILAQMGANVDTWSRFGFDIADIKRYWSPTLTQWVTAGFYDKKRVQQAGWPIDDVLDSLPTMNERCSGRVLRLAF
jgi:hypothetical protein